MPLCQSQRPQSWPELDRFLLRGGLIEIRVGLRAGMDPGSGSSTGGGPIPSGFASMQTRLTKYAPPPYNTLSPTEWVSVDDLLRDYRLGKEPDLDLEDEEVLAGYLCTVIHPHEGPWGDIPSWGGQQGYSQARGVALLDVIRRNPPPHLDPPDWAQGPGRHVDVHINNLLLPELLGQSTPARPELLCQAILTRLQDILPAFSTLRRSTEHATVWQDMTGSIKVRSSPQQKCAIASVLIPPQAAFSLAPLLRREVQLTSTAYVTLAATGEFVEVPLDFHDSQALKQLAVALNIENWHFMAILSDGFRQAWPGSGATCRYSMEVQSTPGQGGARSRLVEPGPRNRESHILLGVAMTPLLDARRSAPAVSLRLGIGLERPVELPIGIPPVPTSSLWRKAEAGDGPKLALLPQNDPLPLGAHLVLGPLPRGWPLRQFDRAMTKQLLASIRQRLEVEWKTPVFFLGERAGNPFAMFVFHNGAGPALPTIRTGDVLPFFRLPRLGEGCELFATPLPPECVEVTGLKALHKALEAHRASSAQAPVDLAAEIGRAHV